MAKKFVRSIRGVKNLEILSENVTDENDLISDLEGNVFVRTINGFINITEHVPKEVIDEIQKNIGDIQKNIEDMKVTNQVQYYKIETNESNIKKLQNGVEELQKNVSSFDNVKESVETLKSDVENIKQDDEDLNKKINEAINNISDIDEQIKNMTTSTGWVDIELSKNIEKYNDKETPQYKITSTNGEYQVDIRGSVKGITERNVIIGNIPLPVNLEQKHPFSQVCTLKRNEKGDLYIPINRWEINTNGDIEMVLLNIPPNDISGTEWCPISTSFQI